MIEYAREFLMGDRENAQKELVTGARLAKTNPQIADTVEPLWVVWKGDLLKEVGYPRIRK